MPPAAARPKRNTSNSWGEPLSPVEGPGRALLDLIRADPATTAPGYPAHRCGAAKTAMTTVHTTYRNHNCRLAANGEHHAARKQERGHLRSRRSGREHGGPCIRSRRRTCLSDRTKPSAPSIILAKKSRPPAGPLRPRRSMRSTKRRGKRTSMLSWRRPGDGRYLVQRHRDSASKVCKASLHRTLG